VSRHWRIDELGNDAVDDHAQAYGHSHVARISRLDSERELLFNLGAGHDLDVSGIAIDEEHAPMKPRSRRPRR
jgi:hypothetical protein